MTVSDEGRMRSSWTPLLAGLAIFAGLIGLIGWSWVSVIHPAPIMAGPDASAK